MNGSAGITVISPGATSPQVRLPGSLNAQAPTWSPSGTQIAFTDYDSRTGELEVFVADAAGSGAARRVTNLSGVPVAPFWASNGLIYVTNSASSGSGTEIVGRDPATGAIRETVTRSSSYEYGRRRTDHVPAHVRRLAQRHRP